MERLPSDAAYFAGAGLILTLTEDSAFIIERKFTDVKSCAISGADTACTDLRWENRYVGAYTMDDSLLTLSFAFTGTTANRWTEDGHVDAGVTVSRYTWEAGNPQNLSLTGVGDGDAFPGKKSVAFNAMVRAKSP